MQTHRVILQADTYCTVENNKTFIYTIHALPLLKTVPSMGFSKKKEI